jgi:hypothetical protein
MSHFSLEQIHGAIEAVRSTLQQAVKTGDCGHEIKMMEIMLSLLLKGENAYLKGRLDEADYLVIQALSVGM